MPRPLLLDLFAGAGGAARGYQQAGFYVVGVDVKPQPQYGGDRFIQGDAFHLPVRLEDFDVVHASPPCQRYSVLAAMHPEREYPDLIPSTRSMLDAWAGPYIMENVEAAPMWDAPLFGVHVVMLCGSAFGLGAAGGYLRRHRLFESNVPIYGPGCSHEGKGPAVGVYGHGGHSGKHRMLYADDAREAMEMDWCNRDGMTQAIPPAYTRFLGAQLLNHLERAA